VAKQHALASLGVSATEEGVYRYFLRHPARKVESAADSIGVDHEVAHVLLRRLRRLGLVRLVDGRGVVARAAVHRPAALHAAPAPRRRPILAHYAVSYDRVAWLLQRGARLNR